MHSSLFFTSKTIPIHVSGKGFTEIPLEGTLDGLHISWYRGLMADGIATSSYYYVTVSSSTLAADTYSAKSA
jgi:hypothetical protein